MYSNHVWNVLGLCLRAYRSCQTLGGVCGVQCGILERVFGYFNIPRGFSSVGGQCIGTLVLVLSSAV
jgi:hypothetical protein